MQHPGGVLLARTRPSNTSIFATGENVNRLPYPAKSHPSGWLFPVFHNNEQVLSVPAFLGFLSEQEKNNRSIYQDFNAV